ncbi:RNA polymerase sigma factor [Pseudarthrobacter sp. P1]|uniref:RNA polymerase sigma factor n=1 Tax=Pseudarthrobacter sp. P1 TaxID=3418418 RepID=UPI003CEC2F3C
MADLLTDEMLLALGQEQEPSVFACIYEAFSPAVLGYLRGRGVDDPEAVTQDVFLTVLPLVGGLRGGVTGLKTLIFSIVHARSVDHHRRRNRTPALVEYQLELDGRTSHSAEDQALDSHQGAGVLSLLEVLNNDQREVLLLRVVADLPLEQVAAIMAKSVGAVKQLQRRALATLKKQPDVLERRGR